MKNSERIESPVKSNFLKYEHNSKSSNNINNINEGLQSIVESSLKLQNTF